MVVINTEIAVEIAGIVVSGIVALFVYLIKRLFSYENRISKLEGKLEDLSLFPEIITKHITDRSWSSARNHTRRGAKNDT